MVPHDTCNLLKIFNDISDRKHSHLIMFSFIGVERCFTLWGPMWWQTSNEPTKYQLSGLITKTNIAKYAILTLKSESSRACLTGSFYLIVMNRAERNIRIPYSWKILRAPIFEEFKVFCLTLKILSWNLFIESQQ